MQEYRVKAFGDHDRRLEAQEVIIPATSLGEAYLKAWLMFPEHTVILVTEQEAQPEFCKFDKDCPCGYPIEDCENCPAHPNSHDPYWKMTFADIV